MSSPERQIANLMERVAAAIAEIARDESGLELNDLETAAREGIAGGFRNSAVDEEEPQAEMHEFEQLVLTILRHREVLEKGLSMGKLCNQVRSCSSVRTFNETVHNLEEAGLVIVTRPSDGEATIRLTGPGIEATNQAGD